MHCTCVCHRSDPKKPPSAHRLGPVLRGSHGAWYTDTEPGDTLSVQGGRPDVPVPGSGRARARPWAEGPGCDAPDPDIAGWTWAGGGEGTPMLLYFEPCTCIIYAKVELLLFFF